MKMTVAVAGTYSVGCKECNQEVENMVASAIRDHTVTGLKLSRVATCDHAVQSQALNAGKPGTAVLPGQQKLPGVEAAHPNGFDTQAAG